MLRIDTIILCVRPDESNVQNPKIVIDVHDKSVLVASDIENNAIALDKAGMPVSAFDVLRAIPVGQCRFPIPGFKRLLGRTMLFPKQLEGAPRDNSHRGTLPCSQFGSNDRICGLMMNLCHDTPQLIYKS